jgi:hypothetical protein
MGSIDLEGHCLLILAPGPLNILKATFAFHQNERREPAMSHNLDSYGRLNKVVILSAEGGHDRVE